MGIFEDAQKAHALQESISKSFFGNESPADLAKRVELDFEKAKKAAVLGEIREFGGKKYKKIVGGWRLVPKGKLDSPTVESKVPEVTLLSKSDLAMIDALTDDIKTLKTSIDDYSYRYTHEELARKKEQKKQAQEKLDSLLTVGDLKVFRRTSDYAYFLSPGPMRLSPEHKFVDYSFKVNKPKVGDYTFSINSAESMEKLRRARADVLQSAKEGKLAWWTPGGYHFGVAFQKTPQGNTLVSVKGRPASAVGKSPQFESYELKGWDLNRQRQELGKFNTPEKVQNYMRTFDGKKVTYV